MEAPSIAEIEEAAQKYVSARDKRMKPTEQEVATKLELIKVMQSFEPKLSVNQDGDRCYRFDDEIVILKSGKVSVKVRTAIDDGTEEED